ncbi:reverse transcriptase family protein [Pimelobacter simplex]|uniref:reverse transcriptase family protein n=1 Tax=Nocardioides simplex TaxID=2045 RepID=UPI00193487F7|nr:RNA-directed DNA polymerase [Pimelobacter simplex]
MIDADSLAQASGMTAGYLAHLGDLVQNGTGYSHVVIPQKRRRPREVLIPSVALDRALKQLRIGLEGRSSYEPHDAVHGFVAGRDIVTNASQHLGQDVVLRVDLADFFGSIDRDRLKSSLGSAGFAPSSAEMIANVALVNGALAQGFSTSPLLSNMSFQNTDKMISDLANQKSVTYTRYVDDLVFSGDMYAVTDDLSNAIETLLQEEGWKVNIRKTRFMRRGKSQYVTGLYVGDADRPHIPRGMKKRLRREVYFASRYGLTDARQHSPTPMDPKRLGGWVHFAAYADPVFGLPLRETWRAAVRSDPPPESRTWDSVLADIGFPEDW